jgi:predicted amidophosphoribosyltransferase
MATPSSPAKTCAICRQDCTNKPRVKDAQGHYFCRDCVEKKKAAQQNGAQAKPASRPAVAVDDERGIMARLVDDSVSKSPNVCPGCRRPLRPETVVCTQCGFNRQTSQVVTTQVLKSEAVKAAKATGRQSRRALMAVFLVILVALILLAVLYSQGVIDPFR